MVYGSDFISFVWVYILYEIYIGPTIFTPEYLVGFKERPQILISDSEPFSIVISFVSSFS